MVMQQFVVAIALGLFVNVQADGTTMAQQGNANNKDVNVNTNVNGNIDHSEVLYADRNGVESEHNGIMDKEEKQMVASILQSDGNQNRRNTVIKSPNVVNQLKNLGRAGAQKQAEPNPYLDDFLSKHAKPVIEIEEEAGNKLSHFYLNLDKRYRFKPNVRLAPFKSFAAPWPMPQEYSSNPNTVFHINPATFQIMILNRTSDILQDAIKRYTEIIMRRSLEEPYSFVNNFHESFARYNTDDAQKYASAQPLPRLAVYVSGSDVGYPQLNSDENYSLIVRPGETRLDAGEVWGALRGLETFSQMIYRRRADQKLYIRETTIRDFPRFSHRGILVDSARHYIHKNVLKQMMEAMSYNKMNVLHWHIVDDQSFPYASEVFPKLSAKGAAHHSMIYTLKDIRELVEFARLRGIRVVPEFDSPGHTLSWGAGHPEIKSTCYSGSDPIGVPLGPIDPSKNETYTFMVKLFQEIYRVFQDQFVHLGGDELKVDCWSTNPNIVKFMDQQAGIPSSEKRASSYKDKVLGYYFKRLISNLKEAARVRKHGASFLMWEDVLRNTKEVPKDSVLQVWLTGQSTVRTVNNKGYKAIYSSCWYLDRIARGTQWMSYYRCDPSPYSAESDEKGKLLGGEACLWAEYFTSDSLMTYAWPRASAVAERLWSKKSQTDIRSATERYQEQRCRMVFRGLPVGHSSGPDHCVLAESPYGEEAIKVDNSPNVMMNIGHHEMGLTFIAQQSQYLPVMNLVLSCVGIYLIVLASKFWRNRQRNK